MTSPQPSHFRRLRAEALNAAGRCTYHFGNATGWLWWCGLAGKLDARADQAGYWDWHHAHDWRRYYERPGEAPKRICNDCGKVRA